MIESTMTNAELVRHIETAKQVTPMELLLAQRLWQEMGEHAITKHDLDEALRA